MKQKILIIDDEANVRTALTLALEEDYDVLGAGEPNEVMRVLGENSISLCLLDLRLGQHDGIELLITIKREYPRIAIIMITAYGSINSSVSAIKNGAFSYLTKPVDIEELSLSIQQALEFQSLNEKVEYLSSKLENRFGIGEIIGKSSAMENVYNLVERVRDIDSSVIVTGESGTGKELAAHAIHYTGRRKDKRFVEVNCAAIPEGLLEEELFGHKKGSFTGALNDSKGKFEYANGGTIFLDEIGDMSLPLQAKLLRVLQQKEIMPIGSNEKVSIDVRVIAATNRNLKEMMNAGTFRQDLFFRLCVVEIFMPPLREKKQDIPQLIEHFISRGNTEFSKNIQGASKAAEQFLMTYNYPGNVRELANIIEYAMIFSNSDLIQLSDLPAEISQYHYTAGVTDVGTASQFEGKTLREIESIVIKNRLNSNNGKVKPTADSLGISDKGLRNKIASLDIKLT